MLIYKLFLYLHNGYYSNQNNYKEIVMELKLHRHTFTPLSTIGDFSIDGKYFCKCLEDTDRGLTSDMLLADIQAKKVYGKTAIPTGRYQVTKYNSPKHGGWVPLLLGVKGFDYVEIHAGNSEIDSLGCLLLGDKQTKDFVSNSRITIEKFYKLFFAALDKNEKIFITIEK